MFKGSVYHDKHFPDSIGADILVYGSPDPEVRLRACERFATLYFDPLVGYLIRNKKFFGNREDAKDLVTDFIFKRLIEKNVVEGFDPNYGGQKRKFRHYLCRSLMWLYQEGQKKRSPEIGLLNQDQVYSEPDAHDLDEAVYEYVLAANLLIQVFLAVKTDCINKNQKNMWDVFAARVIKQSLTGKKYKHADIADELGLESARRSRQLLESGLQKFKAFANRIIKEAEPGLDRRTPEELLKILAKPPIAKFDLCAHLETLADLSVDDNEVFQIETGADLKRVVESWQNDQEVESRDEDEESWIQILNQTVPQYQDSDSSSSSMQMSVSGMMSGSDETLADLLFQPTGHVDALHDIRIASRDALKQCEDAKKTSMHRTVYALVHASDIVHHRTCFSKSDSKSLLAIFKSSLSKPWLDEQSRWQLNFASDLLLKEQIPFPRLASQG